MARDQITTSKESYLRNLYKEDEALAEIRKRAAEDDLPIHISPEEARFLQFLIRSHNVVSIVEIGTHFGYSARAMHAALPAHGQLYTCEKDQRRAAEAAKHFEDTTIQLLVGDARVNLQELTAKAPFDMVFIDANKNAYLDYYEWAVKNVRIHGLIVIDNTFLMGTVYGETPPQNIKPAMVEKMRAFNTFVANDPRVFSTTLPTMEGLTLVFKITNQ